jgi:hypothetical protein
LRQRRESASPARPGARPNRACNKNKNIFMIYPPFAPLCLGVKIMLFQTSKTATNLYF